MEASEHRPDKPPIQSLCEVEPAARKLLRQQGPLREYEASELHLQIYRQFKAEHQMNILRNARVDKKKITEVREYHPRELDQGSITSPECTITVFIPPRSYRYTKTTQTWQVQHHFQMAGNSRLIVEEGPIHFLMVQYDWNVVADRATGGSHQE
ncbi:glycoside hydrolase superfamily [Apiospora arundinis]